MLNPESHGYHGGTVEIPGFGWKKMSSLSGRTPIKV